jgi:hypothetical protein
MIDAACFRVTSLPKDKTLITHFLFLVIDTWLDITFVMWLTVAHLTCFSTLLYIVLHFEGIVKFLGRTGLICLLLGCKGLCICLCLLGLFLCICGFPFA